LLNLIINKNNKLEKNIIDYNLKNQYMNFIIKKNKILLSKSNILSNNWIFDYLKINKDINIFLNNWESKKILVRSFWFRPENFTGRTNEKLQNIFLFWKNNTKVKKLSNKNNDFWMNKNKKIIDRFRSGFGLKDLISNSRNSRNFNRIFKKYNKSYSNIIELTRYKLLKNYNSKIDKLLNKNLNINNNSIKTNLFNKRSSLILNKNKYFQIKYLESTNIKNKLFGNRLFKFHYNFIKNQNFFLLNDYNFDYSDRKKKLKLMSLIYKKNENLNNIEDLKIQQNYSKLNRWGTELGRGGYDWFWLRLNDKSSNLRNKIENIRFNDSWVSNNNDLLRKSLKYLTSNQYTLRLIRSKYHSKELNKMFVYYGKNQNLFNLKYNLLSNFYNFGNFGSSKTDIKIKESYLNSIILDNLLNRIKQPLRVFIKEKSPYSRYNYVILHQKLLNIYLNKKIKYNRIRFLIKPIQIYFRDLFRFFFELKNINFITRNQISLINSNIVNKFSNKYKTTKIKKLILNGRIIFKKNISIYKNYKNKSLFYIFYKNVIKKFYNSLFSNNLSVNQIKKIIKWEIALGKSSLNKETFINYKNNFAINKSIKKIYEINSIPYNNFKKYYNYKKFTNYLKYFILFTNNRFKFYNLKNSYFKFKKIFKFSYIF